MKIWGEPPPATLYKYVCQEVYDEFLSRGQVRLGVSTFYRSRYEAGSGFADADDGVRSASFPAIGQRVRTSNRHYLFCASRIYSRAQHEIWFRRQDCSYDLCLALDAEPLLTEIAKATKQRLGSRLMAWGPCNYGEHTNQVGALKGNIFQDALLKPTSYAQEDEYRLAIAFAIGDPQEPLDLLIQDLTGYVKDHIRL